jgi:hypothetical protein
MPVLKNYLVFKPIKNLTAFLTLNVGVIRSDTTDPERALAQAEQKERPRGQVNPRGPVTNDSKQAGKPVVGQEQHPEEQGEKLEIARARIADQKVQLNRWRSTAQEKDLRIAMLEEKLLTNGSGDSEDSVIDPENIVWIFGMFRTGSAWLGSTIGELEGHGMWEEPGIGGLFGHFFYDRAVHHHNSEGFIMGSDRKRTWLRSIRTFVLDAVEAKYPLLAEGGYLIMNESSGSIGAPLLAQALPESRMIFLIRNPKAVVSSALEAAEEYGWARDPKGNRIGREVALGGIDESPAGRTEWHPDALVEKLASTYLQYAGNAKRAYEEHAGPKVLVRYEDLRTDTLGTMRRIYSELGMAVDEVKLSSVVERHSRELSSEEDGAITEWCREVLTEEQMAVVEKKTAPLLEEFYSG